MGVNKALGIPTELATQHDHPTQPSPIKGGGFQMRWRCSLAAARAATLPAISRFANAAHRVTSGDVTLPFRLARRTARHAADRAAACRGQPRADGDGADQCDHGRASRRRGAVGGRSRRGTVFHRHDHDPGGADRGRAPCRARDRRPGPPRRRADRRGRTHISGRGGGADRRASVGDRPAASDDRLRPRSGGRDRTIPRRDPLGRAGVPRLWRPAGTAGGGLSRAHRDDRAGPRYSGECGAELGADLRPPRHAGVGDRRLGLGDRDHPIP